MQFLIFSYVTTSLAGIQSDVELGVISSPVYPSENLFSVASLAMADLEISSGSENQPPVASPLSVIVNARYPR
jgi:hypothetical protein